MNKDFGTSTSLVSSWRGYIVSLNMPIIDVAAL